jgi:lipopolysaccharide export system permease protein
MIGQTLFRYFMMRYLITTAFFLAAISALIIIADFTQINDRLSGITGFTFVLSLQIAALRSFMILQQTLPFVGLFSAITVLMRLNQKYELVIARGMGLSAWQFLTPLCFGALLFGTFAITIINPLAAKGFALAESYQSSLVSQTSNASTMIETPWIRQYGLEEDVIIGAQSILENGTLLVSPTFVFLDKNHKIIKRIDARTAKLSDKTWTISHASLSKHGQMPKKQEIITLATHFTPTLLQERFLYPDMIPIFQLPEKIEIARAFGHNTNPMSMQYHSVLALPALLIVMVLIAACVSLKFVRFGQSAIMIVGGIVAGFVLYVVTVLVKAFGGAGIIPPIFAAWLPIFMGLLFSISFLLHKEDG